MSGVVTIITYSSLEEAPRLEALTTRVESLHFTKLKYQRSGRQGGCCRDFLAVGGRSRQPPLVPKLEVGPRLL